jgi:RNA polymerase-binding transcription factor DksA
MHTPDFINEMKQRLLDERRTLTGEATQSEQFPDYGRSEEENATEVADYEALQAANKAVTERIVEIDLALERIQKNTYGVTEDGVMISEGRLRANPAATTVIS